MQNNKKLEMTVFEKQNLYYLILDKLRSGDKRNEEIATAVLCAVIEFLKEKEADLEEEAEHGPTVKGPVFRRV